MDCIFIVPTDNLKGFIDIGIKLAEIGGWKNVSIGDVGEKGCVSVVVEFGSLEEYLAFSHCLRAVI